MPWTAPIVGYSDNVGRLRCSQCASAEQRQQSGSQQWQSQNRQNFHLVLLERFQVTQIETVELLPNLKEKNAEDEHADQ